MGRLFATVYDRITSGTEAACLQYWRADLVGGARGRVLEVGAGTGMNVPYYARDVEQLVLSEPDPHMQRQLARRVRRHEWERASLMTASLDALPAPDGAFDTVVGTLVLCSVPRLDRALAEIRRVLAPGGRYLFIEHVAADARPDRLRWQRIIEPFWKRLAGNCHLTRRTEQAMIAAGFTIERCERASMRKAPPFVRPTIRGVAVK